MATSYSSRHSKPLGGNRHAFGGAGLNLGVDALFGETEMVTVFEDFNHSALMASVGVGVPGTGWTTSDITGIDATVGINAQDDNLGFSSSLILNAGVTADSGINAQLVGDQGEFPFIFYDDDIPAFAMDNTVFSFACRVGFMATVASTTWEGKAFIGYANNPDVQIMTPATGAIDVPSANGLLGFHVAEDGHIDLISQRAAADALVSGTNFTQLFPAGTIDYTTNIRPVWFDLAFRMQTRNISDDNDNGSVRAYFRRVQPIGGRFEDADVIAPGARETNASDQDRADINVWREHTTALLNQNPNPASGTGDLVPTVEIQNGPTGAGNPVVMYVDWWAMGRSRMSRVG